ncbi:hypothetical protein JB92DRAFT_2878299 [Gautieria morchelliformis]|nr:hypothetical protein JB92DRAFT_2878299 [Gautieria morchelliformis]
MFHTHHSVQTAAEELAVLEEVPVVEQMDPAHYNSVTTSNGLHNQLAPINRLPNEVLCLIFLLYNPEGQHSRKNMWRYLLITWVCRLWRHLALDFADSGVVDLDRLEPQPGAHRGSPGPF